MPYRIRMLLVALSVLLPACTSSEAEKPRLSLFVGVDVSGSFSRTPQFQDALRFLSYYLHGHLTGLLPPLRPRGSGKSRDSVSGSGRSRRR